MEVIDEIIELSKVLEPLAEMYVTSSARPGVTREFSLTMKDGRWRASVCYSSVGRNGAAEVSVEADTAEEALSKLHQDMLSLAKRVHTWLGRLLEKHLKKTMKRVN